MTCMCVLPFVMNLLLLLCALSDNNSCRIADILWYNASIETISVQLIESESIRKELCESFVFCFSLREQKLSTLVEMMI
jgi:hypothetical protein